MAFDDDGTILAAHIDYVQDAGAYPVAVAGRHRRRWPAMLFPGPYRIPTAGVQRDVRVHEHVPAARRTAGPWQFESVAREVLLDIAARRIGIDPVELRRRNLLRQRRAAVRQPNGMTVRPRHAARDVRARARDPRLRRRSAASRPRRAPRAATSASARAPTSSRPRAGMGVFGTEGATIRIEPSGTVNVYVAGGSAGNSIETTVVQLTADALGRRHRRRPHHPGRHRGHAATAPAPAGAAAAAMTAGAIGEACRGPARQDRRDRRAPARSRARGHRARRRTRQRARHADEPGSRSPSSRSIAYFAARRAAAGHRGGPRGERAVHRARRVHLGERHPRVHVRGRRRHRRRSRCCATSSSEDCGPMINPNVVEGQIAGGTVQGIGGVLFEHLVYDDDGNPLTTTFMDYLLPTAAEVPDDRVRPRRDAEPRRRRVQGRRRRRRHRRAAGGHQRRRRRARTVRRHDHPPAARPVADRRRSSRTRRDSRTSAAAVRGASPPAAGDGRASPRCGASSSAAPRRGCGPRTSR